MPVLHIGNFGGVPFGLLFNPPPRKLRKNMLTCSRSEGKKCKQTMRFSSIFGTPIDQEPPGLGVQRPFVKAGDPVEMTSKKQQWPIILSATDLSWPEFKETNCCNFASSVHCSGMSLARCRQEASGRDLSAWRMGPSLKESHSNRVFGVRKNPTCAELP